MEEVNRSACVQLNVCILLCKAYVSVFVTGPIRNIIVPLTVEMKCDVSLIIGPVIIASSVCMCNCACLRVCMFFCVCVCVCVCN